MSIIKPLVLTAMIFILIGAVTSAFDSYVLGIARPIAENEVITITHTLLFPIAGMCIWAAIMYVASALHISDRSNPVHALAFAVMAIFAMIAVYFGLTIFDDYVLQMPLHYGKSEGIAILHRISLFLSGVLTYSIVWPILYKSPVRATG